MGKTVDSFWVALEEENNRWIGFAIRFFIMEDERKRYSA